MFSNLISEIPIAFRINLSCFGQTQALKNIVESDVFSDVRLDKESDESSKGIAKLLWYPRGLAYQLNLSRFQIRDNLKALKLHSFLISETENGYVSRQASGIYFG